MNSRIVLISFLIAALTVVSACSTKKNSFTRRTYHNLTAHYNGYFNARERVKESAKAIAEMQKDKFDRILPVFKFGDEQIAKSQHPSLNEAIKKCSIVIKRHSMNIKGKEYCRWIDDNWLVIGKAQFFKHDHWAAIETFQYISAEYKESEVRYDALLWLVHSYLQLGKYTDADYLLDFLNNDKKMPQDRRGFFHATRAELHLLKNELEPAAEHLEKAVVKSKKKADRVRYSFILAQIYQKLGDSQKAFQKYSAVVKMNPAYDFDFYSRIEKAINFGEEGQSMEDTKKALLKMTRDAKNSDYLDKIYYALGKIEQKENNEEGAIAYYQKSAASGSGSDNTRSFSYLELGEIFFKKPNYPYAQAYYDSCVSYLSKDYPQYDDISNKRNSLTKLIQYLQVIHDQDSLLTLSQMSSADQEKFISDVIAKEEEIRKEKERLEKELKLKEQQEKAEGQQFYQSQQQQNTQYQGQSGANWYFYNPAAVSFGFNEFLREWGERKLEDDWRRSSRISFGQNAEQGSGDPVADSLKAIEDSLLLHNTELRKKKYLSSIPKSDSSLLASNEKIMDAYYNIGVIYKEQIGDNPEAIKSFEKLLNRYPETRYKAATCYNLYRIYLLIPDEEKAEFYKRIILDEYGSSDYANLIKNPNYFKEKQNKTAIVRMFYENTYRAYLNKQYEYVIERKNMADSMFAANEYSPKFDLLKSLAIGKTQNLDRFLASLNYVVVTYPQDSVKFKAQEIIDYYTRKRNDPTAVDTSAMPSQVFLYEPNKAHYLLIIYPDTLKNEQQLKFKIADFNNEYHSLEKLKVSNSILPDGSKYVVVKEMENSEKALQYYAGLMTQSDAFKLFEAGVFRFLVISNGNFNELLRTGAVKAYEEFYESTYY
ncbi:MAG TPA: tetratricopeptide repeat protein [Bacteroidia bacterium]|nr:tetratricopeptide repeat protein [Bacteroidia bacterium]HNT80746.1 tetratricopeptide repeat protein [Bacteroidia bacterium]